VKEIVNIGGGLRGSVVGDAGSTTVEPTHLSDPKQRRRRMRDTL